MNNFNLKNNQPTIITNKLPNNVPLISNTVVKHNTNIHDRTKTNNTPIINKDNSNKKNFNKNTVEFPSLTNNYPSIIDDEALNQHYYIKDNSNMINRIKSSINSKPVINNNNNNNNNRVYSALPVQLKNLNAIVNNNNNINKAHNISIAKTISNIDTTSLLEENQKLKCELRKIKIDINTHKKQIAQLENEIDKKDKLIDEAASIQSNNMNNLNSIFGVNIGSFSNETNNFNSNTNSNNNNNNNNNQHQQTTMNNLTLKLFESKLINGLKKQFKEAKKELAKKNEEVEEFKKLLKTTKLNELSVENQTLIEEMAKIKEFYKICIEENNNKTNALLEFETLQENFNKQQFIIISLQEKADNDARQLEKLKNEITRDKAIIAERNKKISDLNRIIAASKDYSKRASLNKENNDIADIKSKYEKKISTMKADLLYYKNINDKNESKKRDLEQEIKRIKNNEGFSNSNNNLNFITNNLNSNKSNNDGCIVMNNNNNNSNFQDSENNESKIQIYKSKLNELYKQIKKLEKENKDLINNNNTNNKTNYETANNVQNNTNTNNIDNINSNIKENLNKTVSNDLSHLNNTKLKIENTNLSSNLLADTNEDKSKDITLKEIEEMKNLNEDSFNEIIYILMKNFEANKIDNSVIESAFPAIKNESIPEVVKSIASSVMYLLKNKNNDDMVLICKLINTFINKSDKNIQLFKKEFLSIFENISLFSTEQKDYYNRHIKAKFKNKKDIVIKEFINKDPLIKNKSLFYNSSNNIDYKLLTGANSKDTHNNKTFRFITFVDLRIIFDNLNIKLDAELVEYLIYLMKSSFKDEKASLYDLNYIALLEILQNENINDDVSEINDNSKNNIENNYDDNDDDKAFEITPDDYESILKKLFDKIKDYAFKINSTFTNKKDRKLVKPIDIFKDCIALVEEEDTKERYHIIELKDFVDKLDNEIGLDLKELEIYCLYTKLKFDDVENDLEAISYDKLCIQLGEENKLNSNNISVSKSIKLDSSIVIKKSEALDKNNNNSNKEDLKNKSKEKNNGNNNTINDNLNASINNCNVVSINEFINCVYEYIKLNNKSIDELKNKLLKEVEEIRENSNIMSFSLFNSFLKKEKIINGFVSLNDLTEFAVLGESNDDIMLNTDKFFEYVKTCLNKKDKSNKTSSINSSDKFDDFDIVENSMHLNSKIETKRDRDVNKIKSTNTNFNNTNNNNQESKRSDIISSERNLEYILDTKRENSSKSNNDKKSDIDKISNNSNCNNNTAGNNEDNNSYSEFDKLSKEDSTNLKI